MNKNEINNECKKILDFWNLEEYFTPLDMPYNPTFNNNYSESDNIQFNKFKNSNLDVYYGFFKVEDIVKKIIESRNLNIDNYPDVHDMTGRFYLFSVLIDLRGNILDKSIKVSPFFYAAVKVIQARTNKTKDIKTKDVKVFNENINELVKQINLSIRNKEELKKICNIIYQELDENITDGSFEEKYGLVASNNNTFLYQSHSEKNPELLAGFYIEDIERISHDYVNNNNIIKYISALLPNNTKKTMIDTDVEAIKKWLDADKFPLAKYPSKYSPTLMQQVSINIAISETDRNEDIFSVNGPPGTGKTTLLKEIIASNVMKMAEELIKFEKSKKIDCIIMSTSKAGYTDNYYEIPDCISKYGILVVSNNNGAVENISLDLPKKSSMSKDKTMTSLFDRDEYEEIYFSGLADSIFENENGTWGLISAKMGRKNFVEKVLKHCRFKKRNSNDDEITLDKYNENKQDWEEVVKNFNYAKAKVISIRKTIKDDQKTLLYMYECEKSIEKAKLTLNDKKREREKINNKIREFKENLTQINMHISNCEQDIERIKKCSSLIQKIFIKFKKGKKYKEIVEKYKKLNEFISKQNNEKAYLDVYGKKLKIIELAINNCKEEKDRYEMLYTKYKDKVYDGNDSLKAKYKNNLADNKFYLDIEKSEESQSACPWTYPEYDIAREELFYWSLQVRKAFILKSKVVRRNLFVYEDYIKNKFTTLERQKMFPHLLNTLSIVIPVISSTFASIGSFLKYAGNQSLGMLIIDEAGQAVPQSALGAIYRAKSAVVVGDPQQIEPVVTLPQVLIDVLADSLDVKNEYKRITNSVQVFADRVNEFNGMIGNRQVGCPLVVHRRCIEPMFSISNSISYDNRMFNKTSTKENGKFIINKSGWIDVKGEEISKDNHFVVNQALAVCIVLEKAMIEQNNLFELEDKIFIISPFKSVISSLKTYIDTYFIKRNVEVKIIKNWTSKYIGTVHTFQGKDAEEVFVVLGCSPTSSPGSLNWVVKEPNILNVACTRAKYRIAFIGDFDLWKNRTYFNDFIPLLINKVED